MISSIGSIKRRYANEHKSEIKFEFGVEFVVKVVVEVMVEVSCCLSSSVRVPPSM